MNWKSSITGLMIRIFSALLVLITVFFAQTAWPGEINKKVAFVGKTTITEKDISYKVQIEKTYGNEGATREVALISLVNDAIEYETAKIYGVSITQEELNFFKRYVNEQTKAPEILHKVKLLFGDDLSSYERIYLAPKIMNSKLHDFYSRSPEIHKKERSLIERAYSLVVAGRGFEEAAQECGMEFSTFKIEAKGTFFQLDPLIPILETLFPGDIYRNIVEDDYKYRIIRLIERSSETYSVEGIAVNKQPIDEWFREEAAKIEIEIIDADLKENIKTKYPGIWWVKKLLQKHGD
jgi:hypothetical protein